MKKLSTYLFLILFSLSAPSFADDIRDFQIEGMSIGDSLLDYFSEKEIRKNISNVYSYIEDKTFVATGFDEKLISLKTYEYVQIEFKDNDKDYKIHGITGKLFLNFEENIEACYKKQDEIAEKLSLIFKDTKKYKPNIEKHPADASGRSTVRDITFFLKSGDLAAVDCYLWHKEMPYQNNLKVNMSTKKLNEWLY
jgi:hypothetical protein